MEQNHPESLCGADCSECPSLEQCSGCAKTDGHPFGGKCVAAECIRCSGKAGYEAYRQKTVQEFNDLHVPGMPEVTKLAELAGSFVNLEYPLPGGRSVRLLDDTRIYLGYQLEGAGEGRCFGLVADETYLLVCAYGYDGSDPEILVYRKRSEA